MALPLAFWLETYRVCMSKGLGQQRVPLGAPKVFVAYSTTDPRQFTWGLTRESAAAEYRRRFFDPRRRAHLELRPTKAAHENTLGWVFSEIAKALGHKLPRPVEERKN